MLSKNILIIDKLILALPDDFTGGINSALEKLIQYRSTEDAMMENKGGNFVCTAFDFPDNINPDDPSQLTKESLMQYLADNENKLLAGVISVAEFDKELGGYRNKYTKNETKEFLRKKQELLDHYNNLSNVNVEHSDNCITENSIKNENCDNDDINATNDNNKNAISIKEYANLFPLNICFYVIEKAGIDTTGNEEKISQISSLPSNNIVYCGGNFVSALEAYGRNNQNDKIMFGSICEYPNIPSKNCYTASTINLYGIIPFNWIHINSLEEIFDKYFDLVININKLITDKHCTFRLVVDHMENLYTNANALIWDMILDYYIFRSEFDPDIDYEEFGSSFNLDVINTCDLEMFTIINEINNRIVDFVALVYDKIIDIIFKII